MGTCAYITFTKFIWGDKDKDGLDEMYIEPYFHYGYHLSLWYRLKNAFDLILGRDHYSLAVILAPDDQKKLREWINKRVETES